MCLMKRTWNQQNCHCSERMCSRKHSLIKIDFDNDVLSKLVLHSLFDGTPTVTATSMMPNYLFQATQKYRCRNLFQHAKRFFLVFLRLILHANEKFQRFIFTVPVQTQWNNHFSNLTIFLVSPRFKANIAREQRRGYKPNDRRYAVTYENKIDIWQILKSVEFSVANDQTQSCMDEQTSSTCLSVCRYDGRQSQSIHKFYKL